MGRISCGVQCTRGILSILNILFLLFGVTLLGFGIFVKVSKKLDIALSEHMNTEKVLGREAIAWVGWILIIIAVFTILLAGFGCLGAVFKNRVFLYLYAVILTLIIIAQIAALIGAITYRNRVRDSYYSGFREWFIEGYSNNHTDIQQFIENIERDFKCCGADNVTDYYKHNFTVPTSCHEDHDPHKPIFEQGCAHAAMDWLWNHFTIIGGILAGFFVIEVFGVISSIALGIAISHTSYDYIN